MYPALVWMFPETSQDGPQPTLQPQIVLQWSEGMEETEFSTASLRAKYVLLTDELTSTRIETDFVSYTASLNRVVLQPSTSLSAGKTYRVYLKSGILASSGRRSNQAWQWTFTTGGSALQVTSAPELQSPGNFTVQPVFPTLYWSTVEATGTVTYQIDIDETWEFTSPVYSTTTTASSITPAGSFTSEQTYYWRVGAYTTTASSVLWSDTWSYYYGSPLDADVSSRQFFPDNDIFGISEIGFDDGASNLSAWPTITFTFSSSPAVNFSDYIEITSRAQLPRNDVASSFNINQVDGGWQQDGVVLTFVPSGSIASNTRYDIKIRKNLLNTAGYKLNEEYNYYFSSQYDPMYIDSRVIRSRLLGAEQTLPDDLINFYIYNSSLEANARYYTYLYGTQNWGEDITETIVRDSQKLTSYPVLKWVEASTLYKILKAILFEEVRNIGRSRHMGDSSFSLNADFVKGIKEAMAAAQEEMDQYDDYFVPSEMARTTPKSFDWSHDEWNFDLSLWSGFIGRRDDDF